MLGLMLGLGLISGQGGGGEVSENFALRSLATDTGTTPTTTRITLGATQNAVRVFTDLSAAAEPFFYLYAKRNADAAQKIKIYPWSARILSGAAGDTFAFSTADGRTLSMAAMTVPGALESAFPETGTANADNGCPPYWTPSAAHVTLAAAGSAFQLADTSTSELVFIREYDGSNWTPTRWVRKQSGRATTVRCTYQQIALATRNGATLSIAAPTGAVIGGTSADMVNPHLPAVTGTVHAADTVAEFKTAIAAAVAGDAIELATGSYALDVTISHLSFVANHGVGGRIGMEGITIRGATGDPADVIITGDGVSTNGTWSVLGGATSFAALRDLTFNFSAINARFSVLGGRLATQDVVMAGPASATTDVFAFEATAAPIIIEALRHTCQNGSDDLFNGNGDVTNNSGSRCRFVNCTASVAGPGNSAFQCLTTHNGLPIEWYGGLLEDAFTNIAAPDATTSPIYLFFAQCGKGARDSGLLNTTLFACDVDGRITSSFGAETGSYFSHISFGATMAAANGAFRNMSGIAEHNYLVSLSGSGRALHNSNASGSYDGARYNVFNDFSEGVRFNDSAGAGGTSTTKGNTFISCTTALAIGDNNLLTQARNNVTKGSTTGVNVTATSMANLTTDYNTIDPTIDADYVAGANDLVAGDAALDAFYFPTAAGNCDGNGDATLEDFIGDSDPWGYVRVYKSDRVSRGARDIPAIYSGAYLQPDLF